MATKSNSKSLTLTRETIAKDAKLTTDPVGELRRERVSKMKLTTVSPLRRNRHAKCRDDYWHERIALDLSLETIQRGMESGHSFIGATFIALAENERAAEWMRRHTRIDYGYMAIQCRSLIDIPKWLVAMVSEYRGPFVWQMIEAIWHANHNNEHSARRCISQIVANNEGEEVLTPPPYQLQAMRQHAEEEAFHFA